MCIFCDEYKKGEHVVMSNETCFVLRENSPVSFGHMLIVTKECRKDFFSLTYKEHEDMNMLLKNCKKYLDRQLFPDGYNIGFNCGRWAGQEIDHCAAHLIPRYAGDVPATELKGGIRNFKRELKVKGNE